MYFYLIFELIAHFRIQSLISDIDINVKNYQHQRILCVFVFCLYKFYLFIENQTPSVNGYVKPLLVTHVPGWGGPGTIGSYPATPQMYPHSPDPSVTRDTPSVASAVSDSVSR